MLKQIYRGKATTNRHFGGNGDHDLTVFRDLRTLTEKHRGGKPEIMEGAELRHLLGRIRDAKRHLERLSGNGSNNGETKAPEAEINRCLERILAAHWKLAVSIAGEALEKGGRGRLSDDDVSYVKQIALVALIRSILKTSDSVGEFNDASIGPSFRGYLKSSIFGYSREGINDSAYSIDFPDNLFRRCRLLEATVEYAGLHGNVIEPKEIARLAKEHDIREDHLETEVAACESIDAALKKLRLMKSAIAKSIRLDAEDEDGNSLIENFSGYGTGSGSVDPSEGYLRMRLVSALDRATEKMSPSMRRAFALLSGPILDGWEDPKEVDIAGAMGVSKQAVNRILDNCRKSLVRNRRLREIAMEFGIRVEPSHKQKERETEGAKT